MHLLSIQTIQSSSSSTGAFSFRELFFCFPLVFLFKVSFLLPRPAFWVLVEALKHDHSCTMRLISHSFPSFLPNPGTSQTPKRGSRLPAEASSRSKCHGKLKANVVTVGINTCERSQDNQCSRGSLGREAYRHDSRGGGGTEVRGVSSVNDFACSDALYQSLRKKQTNKPVHVPFPESRVFSGARTITLLHLSMGD